MWQFEKALATELFKFPHRVLLSNLTCRTTDCFSLLRRTSGIPEDDGL
jgi:hypothetical protein